MDPPYPDAIPPNPPPRTRQPNPTAPIVYDTHEPSIHRDDYHNRPYQAKYLKRTVAVFIILCILSMMIWNTVSVAKMYDDMQWNRKYREWYSDTVMDRDITYP
mgnify:CR=1 FL=1